MKFQDTLFWTLVIAGLVILTQNTQLVAINILFWQVSMSKILFVLFFLVIGILIGAYAARKRY